MPVLRAIEDLCGREMGEGGERREEPSQTQERTNEASCRVWLHQESQSEPSFETTARLQNSKVAEDCGGERQKRVCEPKPGDEPREGGSAGFSRKGIQKR